MRITEKDAFDARAFLERLREKRLDHTDREALQREIEITETRLSYLQGLREMNREVMI